MHVFLDTNVLLSLYKLSGMDLEELKKVVKLVEVGKLEVHMNSHVCDEYWRNRESTIKECLDRFTAVKSSQVVPNLLMPYPKTEELRKALGVASDLVKQIREQADEDTRANNLEADKLVEALFKLSKPDQVSTEVLDAALSRHSRGNPPGKGSRIGDEVNWEWLLAKFPKGNDLHIVSADGDYESDLHPTEPREFLLREWHAQKQSNLYLHKSLPPFLKATFPQIKLADEVEKAFLVEKLEKSWSFASTHQAIKSLDKYADFTDDLLLRLLAAYNENNQVYWILEDEDVRAFAEKLLVQAKSKALAEQVAELTAKLAAVDAQKERLAKAGDDDEVPF